MNLGIDFRNIKLMTLSEAIEYMPESAREPLLSSLENRKVIAFTGKMLPPTGWEFVMVMGAKDLFTILLKCVNIRFLNLFFKCSKSRFPGERQSNNSDSAAKTTN
ncbi:hypothetical protein IT084_08490 [Desulfallas sp. Bu1-1]|uniref:hypothetical protein n=1 Tax=Desulfallas sp. Bu1-1 TaxID=2787620 RepID=UPI00189DC278|nr:hypothetical protein [Desulfallas sp. Bu1-1]MBF7083013.1 hypothetical protein [Desulfallas sp. Bu1-1]